MINMIKTGCQLVRVCKTLSLFLFSNVVSVCYVVKSDRLLVGVLGASRQQEALPGLV